MKTRLSRIALGGLLVAALLALVAAPAAAQEPAITGEPTDGLSDGVVVAVQISGFPADTEVTLAQCANFPITGPTDCDISTFGDHTIMTDAEGAGTADFSVFEGMHDPITCDPDNPCYIVAADGITAESNTAAVPITFGVAAQPEQISEMPQTGGEAGLMVIIGISILAAGALFLGLSRRLGRI